MVTCTGPQGYYTVIHCKLLNELHGQIDEMRIAGQDIYKIESYDGVDNGTDGGIFIAALIKGNCLEGH